MSAIEKRFRVGQLADALKNIRPQFGNYNRLKAALKKYRVMQESGGWETVPEGPALKPGMTDDRIPLLRQRLLISGDFRGTNSDSDLYDEELKRMFTNETRRFWMG